MHLQKHWRVHGKKFNETCIGIMQRCMLYAIYCQGIYPKKIIKNKKITLEGGSLEFLKHACATDN